METQSSKLYQDRKVNKPCRNRCLGKARSDDTDKYNIKYKHDASLYFVCEMWALSLKVLQ